MKKITDCRSLTSAVRAFDRDTPAGDFATGARGWGGLATTPTGLTEQALETRAPRFDARLQISAQHLEHALLGLRRAKAKKIKRPST